MEPLQNDSNQSTKPHPSAKDRRESDSAVSEISQTAADFINSQLQLEAEAREALPFKFDTCTRPLGALRQLLFACLTCNPPQSESDSYNPAAVCYSCSVSCHGEHTLVELFNKRNFVCDCGTTRLPTTSPCNLRLNPITNINGGVVSETAETNNKYNHNFRNRFCGCLCDYDAHQQKGTMFQCLGLGTADTGGCGEDWWHPACLVGLGPEWHENNDGVRKRATPAVGGFLSTITEVAPAVVEEREDDKGPGEGGLMSTISEVASAVVDNRHEDQAKADDLVQADEEDEDAPPPPGFPHEDEFDGFICYKCVNANPWIKKYAGAQGFLEPVFYRSAAPSPEAPATLTKDIPTVSSDAGSKKRKTFEVEIDEQGETRSKRVKDEDLDQQTKSVEAATPETLEKGEAASSTCKYDSLPTPPPENVSLFFKADFRDHLCHCSNCFPNLAKHPQLLEEEETYEPPVSESGDEEGGSTVGSGSIYERGESVLKNVDRVKAIEGVMAYNHLKEKLTPFFKEFAESGKAISAEDIKAHFAKMRGDEEAIKQAGESATNGGN